MTLDEHKVHKILEELKIEYRRVEHPPVFTVEEGKRLCISVETGCKNLFLKDSGGKNHYLVIMLDWKKADIKSISKQLNVSKLSFAGEEELHDLLGLKPGEVSPFGLLNDKNKVVTVVIDDELEKFEFVSFHPNVNTATLILTYKDFEKYLNWSKNRVVKVKV